MNLIEQQKRNEEIISKIITRAWEDDTFKTNLFSNPKPTLESFLGRKINTEKEIKVVDQTDSRFIYVNIPAKPNLNDVELSEDELDLVSGGDSDLGYYWKTGGLHGVACWVLKEAFIAGAEIAS